MNLILNTRNNSNEEPNNNQPQNNQQNINQSRTNQPRNNQQNRPSNNQRINEKQYERINKKELGSNKTNIIAKKAQDIKRKLGSNKSKKIKPNKHNKINYTNSSRNTYSQKADIESVMKFFAISCIIIGTIIAGKSVYALTFGRTKPQDTPQVKTEKMGKEVTITISTQYPIKEFKYRWNDGEETEIKGNQTVDISKTIDIPNGNNILNIIVIDYYGNKTEYQKNYLYESTDVIKPTIKFEKVGTKLRIIANDDTALLYMTYQWNDEEPTRIDATESEKELTREIEVEKGRGKLTVVAVDKEENKETVTRTIVGANKPTFTIDAEQNNLVVKAKDDEGIESISIFVDGEEKKFEGNKEKEVTAKVEIQQGTHMIKVVVTSINAQEATRELRATI